MTENWSTTAHVCRECLGRVLKCESDLFFCEDCGVEGRGGVELICGCGISVGEGALAKRRLFQCVPNPRRSTTCPDDFVITFGVLPPAESGVSSESDQPPSACLSVAA
jgi:hypothetical protein